ncbi:hypothetical protein IAG44_00980 [Streptomyces roseirectus]|uniref:Uncharacterized protein n=1 Tax=Streptomyces roseirectus TaxID=2768066 RepID=A0A7H0I5W2_9ACTN|nr:hypothetical protein [Streptomyces roseirectus]QNP68178.1 hypothetical protein IAG44_00980 [Streptomyces roseirectus]
MCGTCRDETVYSSLFGPPDIFRIGDAGLRRELGRTYQGAELDRFIGVFRASRPDAAPARLCFAITTSPIRRDAIKVAEAKAARRAAPVFMDQLACPSPTLVPGTDFPIGSPHASDIALEFAHADQDPGSLLNADRSPAWPACTPAGRATMWLDAECRIVRDPDRAERLYWHSVR